MSASVCTRSMPGSLA